MRPLAVVAVVVSVGFAQGERDASIERARGFVKRGDALARANKHDEAVEAYDEAVALFERHGVRTAEAAKAANDLGFSLLQVGRFQRARQAFAHSAAMYRSLFGDDHPSLGPCLNNLAYTLCRLGRPGEAVPLHGGVRHHRLLYCLLFP